MDCDSAVVAPTQISVLPTRYCPFPLGKDQQALDSAGVNQHPRSAREVLRETELAEGHQTPVPEHGELELDARNEADGFQILRELAIDQILRGEVVETQSERKG